MNRIAQALEHPATWLWFAWSMLLIALFPGRVPLALSIYCGSAVLLFLADFLLWRSGRGSFLAKDAPPPRRLMTHGDTDETEPRS